MESKITVDVDDFVRSIEKWSDRKELAERLMLETLWLSNALNVYKKDGITDKDILDEIDDDVIISYLESEGYTVTKD